jgi:hypothetical protein
MNGFYNKQAIFFRIKHYATHTQNVDHQAPSVTLGKSSNISEKVFFNGNSKLGVKAFEEGHSGHELLS